MLTQIQTDNPRQLIRNVHVLDVERGQLGDLTNVLAEDGVLIDLAAAADPPVDCDVIEGDGAVMSPGLIDCHCHILSPYMSEQKNVFPPWMLGQIRRNFEAALATGIVCVRDMLSPIKIMNIFRRKIAAGKLAGPRIMASGAILSCAGGYPTFVKPMPYPIGAMFGQPKEHLTSPERAAAVVRYLISKGADHIKVGYTSYDYIGESPGRLKILSDDCVAAIVREARAAGKRICAHHNVSHDLMDAICAGFDSIEHTVSDKVLTDDELDRVRQSGTTLVPTLAVSDSMARFEEKKGFLESDSAKQIFEEPARRHLLHLADTWLTDKPESCHKSFGSFRGNRKSFATEFQNVRNYIKKGVRFVAGTDTGAAVTFPGEIVDEVERFHAAGMSKLEALKTATLEAARHLDLQEKIGSVAKGKLADVLLLDGNPLEDLGALRRIKLVGSNGQWRRPAWNGSPDFWAGFGLWSPN